MFFLKVFPYLLRDEEPCCQMYAAVMNSLAVTPPEAVSGMRQGKRIKKKE